MKIQSLLETPAPAKPIEEGTHDCPLCDFECSSERLLGRHMAVEHPDSRTLDETDLKMECDHCGRVFDDQGELDQHTPHCPEKREVSESTINSEMGPVEYLKNPNPKQTKWLISQSNHYDETALRGWLDGPNLYLWDAFDAVHFDMNKPLKIGAEGIPVFLTQNGKGFDLDVTASVSATNWRDRPKSLAMKTALSHSGWARAGIFLNGQADLSAQYKTVGYNKAKPVAKKRVKEAVRPTHVRAQAQHRVPQQGDQINAMANQIESAIDEYLQPGQSMRFCKVWHENGQVHVKLTLLWEPIWGPGEWCSVRVGLDENLARFDMKLKEQIRHIVKDRYARLGWHVEMSDKLAYFTHPEG